jgi:hypothetical protein
MSAKHPKPSGGKPHSQPNQTGTAEQKRSITGDVHVRGEVTIEASPEEALARKTETDKQDARERKRWWPIPAVSCLRPCTQPPVEPAPTIWHGRTAGAEINQLKSKPLILRSGSNCQIPSRLGCGAGNKRPTSRDYIKLASSRPRDATARLLTYDIRPGIVIDLRRSLPRLPWSIFCLYCHLCQ